MKIEIIEAYHRLADIKKLFTEYVTWLGLPLDFQNYDDEFSSLPGKYAKPNGRLYILLVDEKPAGCVALRYFDIAPDGKKRCEIKRLFVRDPFKGKGFGKLLANKVIEDARQIGYSQMLLDSFTFMENALELYKKLGFKEIQPYCYNPHENVKYMSLAL